MELYEIIDRLGEDKVKFVQLQFTDLYGIVKSLTIPVQQITDAIDNGIWFDGSSILGFSRICESDMYLKPDPSTYAVIPWLRSDKGNTARFICNVYNPDGNPFSGDPRYVLQKIVSEAEALDLEYCTGPEMEFFLFKTDNGLSPLPHDRASYFDLTMDEAYDIRRDISLALEEFGIEIETVHHEVAIGQHEISFKYDNALRTADNAITVRFAVKAIAQKNGLHATFMPKPLATVNGSGMHVHQSLFYVDSRKNAFYREEDKYSLSELAYHFIAGQLTHINGMSAVLSPTVNSYKRLVPGYEAPVYICWGRTNRSALIRVPSTFRGNPDSTRLELRSPDPSCNIYLAFAVMLKSGLDGIAHKLVPPAPLEEDIYLFSDDKLRDLTIETIPHNLWQALKALKKDKVIQEALGEHTLEKYVEAKTREWDEYSIQVSQWEIDKYLELY
ncbi:MAG: type I glutamate--ammonia ligase [Candidatus Cloacimonetes bacterium]|nr:type I glutamate--ammonia ligase [Candidatus Cloacimonadota bacterium]